MRMGIWVGVIGWWAVAQLGQAPAARDAVAESLDVRYARAQLQLAVLFHRAGFERVEFPGQTTNPAIPEFLDLPKN